MTPLLRLVPVPTSLLGCTRARGEPAAVLAEHHVATVGQGEHVGLAKMVADLVRLDDLCLHQGVIRPRIRSVTITPAAATAMYSAYLGWRAAGSPTRNSSRWRPAMVDRWTWPPNDNPQQAGVAVLLDIYGAAIATTSPAASVRRFLTLAEDCNLYTWMGLPWDHHDAEVLQWRPVDQDPNRHHRAVPALAAIQGRALLTRHTDALWSKVSGYLVLGGLLDVGDIAGHPSKPVQRALARVGSVSSDDPQAALRLIEEHRVGFDEAILYGSSP